MSNFNKINSQFNQFIKEKSDSFGSYEKKIINIIKDNFDDIASRGTSAGKGNRASFINELINKKRDTISDKLLSQEKLEDIKVNSISNIQALEIEGFRGFSENEIFILDKPRILVYGPNGSGKSSFCEALEYGMLGYINEAESRRIPLDLYIKNINFASTPVVKLMGVTSNNEFIPIPQDPINFNFCFIEKNRLLNFAKISASPAGEQKSLLAALFGLDDFNDFIGKFTRNITNYIPIESEKKGILNEKEKELIGCNQIIETSVQELKKIEEGKFTLVNESKLENTFIELDIYKR